MKKKRVNVKLYYGRHVFRVHNMMIVVIESRIHRIEQMKSATHLPKRNPVQKK